MRCGVALARDLDGGRDFFKSTYIFCRELDGCASEIFFQPRELGRSRDRNDPRLLGEQPCESDLRRRSFLLLGEPGDDLDECLVGLAIFFTEARHDSTEVGAVEFRGCVDFAGEEPLAERAEGDKADSEFFEGGHDGAFGLAPEEGVLALQCRHGLHCVSAADGFRTCFR